MDIVWIICTYFAILVLPFQNSGDEIVYVRHYPAEKRGLTTRRCGSCICLLDDTLPYYEFGCISPEKFSCIQCCMQPPSLKAAASECVFAMCNKEKTRLDQVTYCSSVSYYPEFDSDFKFGWATSHQTPSLRPGGTDGEMSFPCLGIVTLPAEMLSRPAGNGARIGQCNKCKNIQLQSTVYYISVLHKSYKLLVLSRVIYECARIRRRFNKRCRS